MTVAYAGEIGADLPLTAAATVHVADYEFGGYDTVGTDVDMRRLEAPLSPVTTAELEGAVDGVPARRSEDHVVKISGRNFREPAGELDFQGRGESRRSHVEHVGGPAHRLDDLPVSPADIEASRGREAVKNPAPRAGVPEGRALSFCFQVI